MSRTGLAGASKLSNAVYPSSSTVASTAPEAAQSVAERRAHRRHAAEEIPFVHKVRLKYGPAVTLIDLSIGGAQIQTSNVRLQPGSTLVLEISGSRGDVSVPARVLRCQLASLLPEPVYRGALAFKRELDLQALGAPNPATESPEISIEDAEADDGPLDPASEAAQLRRGLARLALGEISSSASAEARLEPMIGALDAAYRTLETAAGRRAGPALSEELADLFNAVATALERRPTAAALMAAIEEHLRHVVPARAIRLADASAVGQTVGAEAILLSVPRLSPDGPALRLAVEFEEGAELMELHLQILKAGIQLIAIAGELGRLNGADRPLVIRSAEPLPAGWSRVMVEYNNRQTRTGYTHDFVPEKGYLTISPEPVVSPNNRVMLPFTDLKAIFFADGGDGRAAESRPGDTGPAPVAQGRHVRVTFRDREQLVGTIAGEGTATPGFFLASSDGFGNEGDYNRAYVLTAALSGVETL
ncbi:MAG: PilZ domain-containing protein [Vicinamibacterales bacterium]